MSAYVSTDGWFHGHLHISAYSRDVAGHQGRTDAWVIHGGVDTARFSPDATQTRGPHALFVGRILPHKGLDDLVDAAGADTAVRIVGPAPAADYLRAAPSAARPAGPSASCTGSRDDALVAEYRRCRLHRAAQRVP